MNCFLKSRSEIDQATNYLKANGYIESGISCKNWEIAQVLPHLDDGNLLDMGASGSVVLENALTKGISGVKFGIDLAYPENIVSLIKGIDLVKGDLMNTPFPDGFFNTLVSLSTIEHQVDFKKFAKECSRLLSKGGTLYVSFDYWRIKADTSKTKLYSLDWNILDTNDVLNLIFHLGENGLVISGDIDWTLQDAVINDRYCSPAKGVAYTLAIFSFIKA